MIVYVIQFYGKYLSEYYINIKLLCVRERLNDYDIELRCAKSCDRYPPLRKRVGTFSVQSLKHLVEKVMHSRYYQLKHFSDVTRL